MIVSRKNHNPSIARRILRDLKRGESPEKLIPIAKGITDSYYSALGLTYIVSVGLLERTKSEKLLKLVFSKVDKVEQSWRRLELLGEISKRLKNLKNGNLKDTQYKQILKFSTSEKKEKAKDFFVKNAKNFPPSVIESLLTHSLKLKGYEFESSKAVIRHWVNSKPVENLIKILSKENGDLRIKLLGYLHLQLNKSKISIDQSPLEIALKYVDSEEMLRYLVRVCSKPADLDIVELHLSNKTAEEAIPISIALIARADRKGWNQHAHHFAVNTEKLIESILDPDLKSKFNSKLQITTDRLKGEKIPTSSIPKKPLTIISDSGKNTLGIYNTYGGNWNHPHYKAVFKAANLCSAFDLNMALIDFPEIESERLVNEIKKEMRLPNEGYLSQLLSKNRVRFFEKDIDESWAGIKVVTTENPDSKKLKKPDGKICMVMGLGPSGLPKSYVSKCKHHFEITDSGVGFETGTAMGAIAGHLHLMQ